jgi:preprotein translocase subunit SecG
MNILIWLLTFVLVLDCLVLTLLVLIQLPKKEAGMGQAFGGGATDALFGAGSGTALTKMTKYAAGIFFGLTLLISVLFASQARRSGVDPRSILSTEDKLSLVTPAAASKSNTAAAASGSVTNTNTSTLLLTAPTNAVQGAK